MRSSLHRGVGWARGAWGIVAPLGAYAGAFAVLWALGLVVRGWQGWILLSAPLLAFSGYRAWAWRRVCLELADGMIRYEGSRVSEDFEVPIEQVVAMYHDGSIPERPLVLALADGDERVCAHLGPIPTREAHARLRAAGVPSLQPDGG